MKVGTKRLQLIKLLLSNPERWFSLAEISTLLSSPTRASAGKLAKGIAAQGFEIDRLHTREKDGRGLCIKMKTTEVHRTKKGYAQDKQTPNKLKVRQNSRRVHEDATEFAQIVMGMI